MVDFDNAEIMSLEALSPGKAIFVCVISTESKLNIVIF